MNSTRMVIETQRLRLRSHRDDDLFHLVALIGNWEVVRWVSTVPHPYTETHGREWIASVRKEHATGCPRRFAIALKDTDSLIGGVGIDGNPGDSSEEPALGYWLGQPYWGNQYGREAVAAIIDYAFRTLGIETIRAYTDPANPASQKVLQHCGLKRFGEIELAKPTRNGAFCAPLFRISRQPLGDLPLTIRPASSSLSKSSAAALDDDGTVQITGRDRREPEPRGAAYPSAYRSDGTPSR